MRGKTTTGLSLKGIAFGWLSDSCGEVYGMMYLFGYPGFDVQSSQ